MVNVLLVSNYSSDTGYAWWLMEHFWRSIRSKLPPHSSAFLAYPEVTTVNQNLIDAGIKIIELTFNAGNSNDRKAAMKFVKNNNIKTVYFTDRPYFSTFYFMLRLYGVKTIIVHDHTPGDRPQIDGIKGITKSIRNRLPMFTADAVFNVSPLMRKRSIKNGRIPHDKCFSVQNGLPINDIAVSRKSGQRIRESLNIDSTATIAVCSSRLHEYKNVQFAIEVFASTQLCSEGNSHLLILGDGPYETQLRTLASKQECRNKIHFLGFREDVKEILSECDLAIHCSRGEGFSLSIIEFMWSGIPVLVPDIPSVSQAITNEVTGLIYRNDDLDDAKRKLNQLLGNPATRQSMGAAAKQTVVERYTMERTDHQFSAALEKVGI